MKRSKKQIGQILLEQKIINQDQLEYAIFVQFLKYKQLGQILIDLGYINQTHLEEALAIQNNKQLIADNDF
jgi:hypothetical protein